MKRILFYFVALIAFASRVYAQDPVVQTWDFDTAGNMKGWTTSGYASSGVNAGYFWGTTTSTVPVMTSPAINLASSTGHYVEIRMKMHPSANPNEIFGASNGSIFFTTEAEPTFDSVKRLAVRTFGNGVWRTYKVRTGGNAKWSGTIKSIRFDPSDQSNARIEIAYIRIMRDVTPPTADVKNFWTYEDNETIRDNSPIMLLRDLYDEISEIARVEFWRRPGNSTSESDWSLIGIRTPPQNLTHFKYPALPNGTYDLGVKIFDRAGNISSWLTNNEYLVDNLTINTSTPISVNVDAGTDKGDVAKMLSGHNILWTHFDNEWNPVTESFPPALEAKLADLGETVLRYPGGCWTDTFYWKNSIGPINQRISQKVNNCAPQLTDKGITYFGIDEFVRMCRGRNIEPMISLRYRWPGAAGIAGPGMDGANPYQQALDDARDLVEYLNHPNDGTNPNGGTNWAAVRAANGHPEPYNVRLFELGNEPFGPDPWGSPGKVGLDGASVYAVSFLTYKREMQAIDPDIQLVPSTFLEYDNQIGFRADSTRWAYTVYSVLAPYMDAAQFHNYHPYSPSQTNLDYLYAETMAAPRGWDESISFQRLYQRVTNPGGAPIPIWLSEYNINYYWVIDPSRGWVNMEHGRTLKTAIALADTLRIFQENSDLMEIGNWWLLFEDSAYSCISDDLQTVFPAYHVFRMFNKHYGDKVVHSKVYGSPTFEYTRAMGGIMPDAYGLAHLTSMASKSADGKDLYLMVVNKHPTDALSTTVNLNGFLQAGPPQRVKTSIWELKGNDPHSFNAPQTTTTIESLAVYDGAFQYSFPKHSVTSFKFTQTAQGETSAPTLSIGAPSATVTNTGPLSFPVTYSGAYAVTLSPADVTVNKTGTVNVGSVTVNKVNNWTYNVNLNNITGNGTVGVSIAAGTANDGAGSFASAAGPSAITTIDNSPPTVTIGAPSRTITTVAGFNYVVSYTDAASINLSESNVVLNKTGTATGSVVIFGTGNSQRTVQVTNVSGDGTLSISINPGSAVDSTGNLAPAAGPSQAVTVDNTAPSVQSITGPVPAVTGFGPAVYTVMFTEPVVGFNSNSDIQLNVVGTAQTGSIVLNGSGAGPYTVTLQPLSGDGSLGITVKAGACSDAAGNLNIAGSSNQSVTVDNTPPSISVSAPSQTITQNGPVSYTVTYNGADTISLSSANINLVRTGTANGTINVTGSGNTTRTVTISGITGDGTLAISIPFGSAQDAAGNFAPSSGTSQGFTVDNTPPTVSLSGPSVSTTANGPVTYTVTFNGAVTILLNSSHVTLNKTGTADAGVSVVWAGPTQRTIVLSNITGSGTLGVSIAADTAEDQAGNISQPAGPSSTVQVNPSAVSLAISTPSVTPTRDGPVSYTVTYANATSVGLTSGHVTLNKTGTANGTVNVSGSGLTTRTVTITGISGDGIMSISIASGSASNGGVQAPSAGPSATFTVDNTGPALTIGAPSVSLTNGAPVSFPISYTNSESITLAPADVTLNTTGNVTGTISVSGTGNQSRTVTVTSITGNGTFTISIGEGTATGGSGSTAPAVGPSQTVTVDTTPPTPVISEPSILLTRNTPIVYTVTYSGASEINLTPAYVSLVKTGTANGTAVITGSGNTTRTVTVSDITGDGTLGIAIAAGSAVDAAGNTALAAGPTNPVVVDNTGPQAPVVIDEGDWSPSLTRLRAVWGPAFDGSGGGVDFYQYAIGTSPGATNVKEWTSVGNVQEFIDTSLTLSEGNTYYIQVRGIDKVGLTGVAGISDGITVPAAVPSIGLAWSMDDGIGFTLRNKIVTAVGAGVFWLQEPDRSAAIKVFSSENVIVGQVIDIAGTMGRSGPQRVFFDDIVEIKSTGPSPVAPFMYHKWVGGRAFNQNTPGLTQGYTIGNSGHTVGLLVTMVGRIVSVNNSSAFNKYFFLEDGSVPAWEGYNGMRVNTGTLNAPATGTVKVTGVIGLYQDGSIVLPDLTLRSAADIVPVGDSPPLVFIGNSVPTLTRNGPVTFEVTYAGVDNISLTAQNITLNKTGTANGVVSVAGNGPSTRTVTVSDITGDGTLTISLAGGTATGPQGIAPAAGPSPVLNVDNTPPTVNITGPSVSSTKNGPVTYTIDILGASQVPLSNQHVVLNKTGTANGNLDVSGFSFSQRTVTISNVTGEGSLSISLLPGAARDAAGNLTGNIGPSGSFTVDNTPPAISISSPSTTATNAGPVAFVINYDGASNISLSSSDITLNATGSATGTVSVTGSGNASRTVSIGSISGEGSLGISIAAGTAVDQAGNIAPSAGPSATFNVDNTPPTVQISGPSVSATKTGPVTYSVSFNGADTVQLTAGNVTLNKTGTANGTVSVSGSGPSLRTVTISGITGDGTLGISVGAGVSSDLAGNESAATGASQTFTVANSGPQISISAPSTTSTVSGPVTYTVSYTGASTITLNASNITLNKTGSANGVVNVTGSGSSRTVTVSSITGAGTLGISIAAGTAEDAVGNLSDAAGPSQTFTASNVPLSVTISSPSATHTRTGPVTYTVSFAGAVSVNMSASNVTLNKTGTANGTVSVSGSGTESRTVTVSSISGNGTLSISLAAGIATGGNGSGSSAVGPSISFTVDNTAPTNSLSGPSATITNTGPVTYTVTYSGADNITLSAANVTLNKTGSANGTVGISGSGSTRTVTISGITGEGTLGISIAAGTASDLAGNTSAAMGPSTTFTVDNTPPTAFMTMPNPNVTRSGPSNISVTYSQASQIFLSPSYVTLNKTGTANATVTTSGTSGVRTITLNNCTGDGTITVTVNPGSAVDTAGNQIGQIGPSMTLWVDNTPPTVSIVGPSSGTTSTSNVTYTINYGSANSVSLSAGNITLNKTGTANATVSVSGTGNAQRIVTLSNISGNGTLGISIAAGTASDNAGNTAPAAGPSSVVTVVN